jgi:hypothetical protein
VVDRRGIPIAVVLTAAEVHDSKAFKELVDSVEPIKRPGPGRPRKRPKKLHDADKGVDFPRCEKALRKRGITRALPGEGVEHALGPVGEDDHRVAGLLQSLEARLDIGEPFQVVVLSHERVFLVRVELPPGCPRRRSRARCE